MNNKVLCKHTQGFLYAFHYQTAGFTRPTLNVVFYCPMCCRLKVEVMKNLEKDLMLSK